MTAPRTAPRARKHHVDLMRVITFACVVLVHTVGSVMSHSTAPVAALDYLMHFTRYAFVAITVFVLFVGYYRRDDGVLPFYRRRFGLVVLPYLLWSGIYLALTLSNSPWRGFGGTLRFIGHNIVYGSSWYHLYFLLVSMQIYLVFPLLRWLLRRTEGHHGLLAAGAWVLQLGYMYVVAFVPAPAGWAGWLLWGRSFTLLPMYIGFAILGALAAVHYERMHAWVTSHLRLLGAVASLGLMATGVIFYVRVYELDTPPRRAAMAMHPAQVVPALAMILALYVVGTMWLARRRDDDPLARFVDAGSVRAFGVYACHPLAIWLLGQWFTPTLLAEIPYNVVRVPIVVLAVYVTSVVLVELMLRSPFAKQLVARDRMPLLPRRQLATAS
ncbi:acyltransferase [Actinophytocola gossypii]|uniref:Acyltransferase n=1 Tax=Actinophytocola gossypii TaxID=2812003 RepID=A0ABT2J4S0_9PSEU|nr:acyltransferase [Actinophytocola gossypii]MCT2582589.1 acyltransferase [Actinophytocola gossypii]